MEDGEVMALRVKQMSKQEFANVAERQWVPVVLSGEACPQWMRGIPKDIVGLVLAAVISMSRINRRKWCTYSGLVGGIEFIAMIRKMKHGDSNQ